MSRVHVKLLGLAPSAWVWLSLGGALGALGRALLVFDGALGHDLSATLFVNALGSFVLGFWAHLARVKAASWPSLQAAIPAFCGGFTTFSGLTADVLFWGAHWVWAAVWLWFSASVSVGCLALGWWVSLQVWHRHQRRSL